MVYGDMDPEYLRLYRQYAKAIRMYEIALQKRRAFRERMTKKVANADYRIPQGASRSPGSPPKKKPFRVYLGTILGWITLQESSPKIGLSADPTADFDVEALHSQISRKLWLNAKDEYSRCKKAFFDYALRIKLKPGQKPPPKRDYSKNLELAQYATGHGANLQLLGIDKGAEKAMRQATMHVETACYKAWENYVNAPEPKSRAAVVDLIEMTAESMLYPLDDNPITQKMTNEINHMINDGILKKQ